MCALGESVKKLGTLFPSSTRNDPEIAVELKKFIGRFICIKTRSDSVGELAGFADNKPSVDMPEWILDACSGTIAFDVGLKLVREAHEIDLRLFFSHIYI